MFKFGLKLFSINITYIPEIKRIYEKNIFDYIELYSYPDSYESNISHWKNLNIPFIIHAAHFGNGMNLAEKNNLKNNLKLSDEAKKFADSLNSNMIIFHPGVEGSLTEVITQLRIINDNRIVIENKPQFSICKKYQCRGDSPEEIEQIIKNTNYGFCLDIGHAICSANAKKILPIEYIKKFISLNPEIYHLTDGFYDSITDNHLNYGKGNFPLKEILNLIPKDSYITNEAKKNNQNNLSDFIEDIKYIKKIL